MDKKIIKNNISRNCIASDCIGVISSYTPFKEGNARFTIVPLNLCLGKNYFCLKIDNFILCVLCKIGITNTNLPVNLPYSLHGDSETREDLFSRSDRWE